MELLWIDLEMTGLLPDKDIILEAAAIVTDQDYKPKAKFEAVINPGKDIRPMLDEVVLNMHTSSGLLDRLSSGQTESEVVAGLGNFIDQKTSGQMVILAGNSIHMDRQFINHRWPSVNQRLHYRMLDVSSFKILFAQKYGFEYQKQETHRAMDDILESIDELKFYESKMELKNAN